MNRLIAQKLLASVLESLRSTRAMHCLEELEKSQWWSHDAIIKLQDLRIEHLVLHAYNNVPYYRRVFNERGIRPNQIQSGADLVQLPVLSKQLIRDNFHSIATQDTQLKNAILTSTGGSTGEPLVFYSTKEDQQSWGMAAALRAHGWYGREIGDKVILFRNKRDNKSAAGRCLYSLKHKLEQIIEYDVGRMSPDQMDIMVHTINCYKPKFVAGYPSALYLLAKHIEKGSTLTHSAGNIITGGEQLHDYQREYIQGVFQCSVHDHYASWEAVSIAAECPEYPGYHIAAENVFVEIVDHNNAPVTAGTEGRILITNLHNYAMPLIRYDIGDIGVLSSNLCPCGRGLPILAELQGRTTDVITTMSQGEISGMALNRPFRELAGFGIDQFQIIQESQARIALKLVLSPNSASDQSEKIREEVFRRFTDILGEDMNIAVDFVEHIPAETSGKRRAIMSKLTK